MLFKIILTIFILFILLFIAFRFGLFEGKKNLSEKSQGNEITFQSIITPPPPIPAKKETTSSASIKIISAPKEASASQPILLSWLIENPTIATISHTAIHFGKTSRPDAKLPSDYPEKSTIFKGIIPASFSAVLKIYLPGIYYYRANAIVDDINIWSAEDTIIIQNF
ncbi:hypothetical protein HYT17_00930 [Candidatus Microgenomates bacterium]|nr:hypothetical protein [Candidatus Microgenomates bacterium]